MTSEEIRRQIMSSAGLDTTSSTTDENYESDEIIQNHTTSDEIGSEIMSSEELDAVSSIADENHGNQQMEVLEDRKTRLNCLLRLLETLIFLAGWAAAIPTVVSQKASVVSQFEMGGAEWNLWGVWLLCMALFVGVCWRATQNDVGSTSKTGGLFNVLRITAAVILILMLTALRWSRIENWERLAMLCAGPIIIFLPWPRIRALLGNGALGYILAWISLYPCAMIGYWIVQTIIFIFK